MKKRDSKPKRRRRQPRPRRSFPQLARRFGIIAFWLMLSGGVASAVTVVGLRVHRFVQDSEFFEIETIRVDGASPEVELAIVELISRLKADRTDNLFALQPTVVRSEVESLSHVRTATVRKVYPSTLQVEVTEREPFVAINADDLYWIDEEGVLIERAEAAEIARADVPILTGVRAPRFYPGQKLDQERLAELLDGLRFLKQHDPELFSRFAEWNLNARDEIVGILREGVEVRFGRRDPLSRLPVLEAVMSEKKDLAQYTYLDLRFDSQVVYF